MSIRSAMFVTPLMLLAMALPGRTQNDPVTNESWDRDVGKPAPPLMAAGWIGTPLTLQAVRGNTVILAFWNADIPC